MMEGDAAMVRIQRKSSIESEPRTLTMDQIHFAREAALYVVNTRSIEEALSIFTEGLEPVGGRKGDRMTDISREIQCVEELEQLRLTEIRDIVSAPF
ncbi:PREDICTED: uncharacterized protein LOC105131187 isoform X1 [Populus euphratica]|uniref:Uncharacterized protein LOC105131187 isoform X1 n=1 Tax=Populus euphratica TaxID=75702 RepID=A0AAJ6UMU9_POPEU|nr:PREDICTED: uncharacterized protein LOC105131187 isoform X1 [Populus euphratica]